MLEPFRSGHGHTQGIGDRRCEAHACLTGGDLLCRAPDVPGPAVTLSDQSAGLVAFSWSVGRERPGEVEGGELDELGGEHPSAEDAVVAVEELEAGDGRTRAESVDDDVVVAAQSAGVGVALQAVADPVVAQPAEPEEPSGLDGAAGKSDATGVNGLGDAGGDEVDLTVVGDSHDLRFGEEVCARRRGARQTVVSVPFFASTGHGNPTQKPQRTHPARPFRASVLISSGTRVVDQPSCSAAAARRFPSTESGQGAIG